MIMAHAGKTENISHLGRKQKIKFMFARFSLVMQDSYQCLKETGPRQWTSKFPEFLLQEQSLGHLLQYFTEESCFTDWETGYFASLQDIINILLFFFLQMLKTWCQGQIFNQNPQEMSLLCLTRETQHFVYMNIFLEHLKGRRFK